MASFQIRDRAASRLQCSVAKIWAVWDRRSGVELTPREVGAVIAVEVRRGDAGRISWLTMD
jgi:hypothetical protein